MIRYYSCMMNTYTRRAKTACKNDHAKPIVKYFLNKL